MKFRAKNQYFVFGEKISCNDEKLKKTQLIPTNLYLASYQYSWTQGRDSQGLNKALIRPYQGLIEAMYVRPWPISSHGY